MDTSNLVKTVVLAIVAVIVIAGVAYPLIISGVEGEDTVYTNGGQAIPAIYSESASDTITVTEITATGATVTVNGASSTYVKSDHDDILLLCDWAQIINRGGRVSYTGWDTINTAATANYSGVTGITATGGTLTVTYGEASTTSTTYTWIAVASGSPAADHALLRSPSGYTAYVWSADEIKGYSGGYSFAGENVQYRNSTATTRSVVYTPTDVVGGAQRVTLSNSASNPGGYYVDDNGTTTALANYCLPRTVVIPAEGQTGITADILGMLPILLVVSLIAAAPAAMVLRRRA